MTGSTNTDESTELFIRFGIPDNGYLYQEQSIKGQHKYNCSPMIFIKRGTNMCAQKSDNNKHTFSLFCQKI